MFKPKVKKFNWFVKFITFGFAYGITLAPFGIYIDEEDQKWIKKRTINHETIHWKQQMEMLIIPFYIWYVVEWFIRIIGSIFGFKEPYRNLSFEREAYTNDDNLDYLKTRKHYTWVKYIFNKTPKL